MLPFQYSQLSKRIEFLGLNFGKNKVAPDEPSSSSSDTAGLMKKMDKMRVDDLMDKSNEDGVNEEKEQDKGGDASMELGFLGLSGKQDVAVEEHSDDEGSDMESVGEEGDGDDEDDESEDEKWAPIIKGTGSSSESPV
eukprot:TRINITY_DN912_c1_g1_i12.p2 TRINITY_DN912_c1_g1~~TRINITY_DN912_c1_g1_i12.p2  ORF type:complete len:138 (+),score=62.46 TRINITY_DN912_c1_g1_i12:144-557(+)